MTFLFIYSVSFKNTGTTTFVNYSLFLNIPKNVYQTSPEVV